jgi:hypothetical protein
MIGRHVLVELLHVAAGLAAGLAMTVAAAWAYPLGHDVIWACGLFAMAATVAMGVGPLRRAAARDRHRISGGEA